MSKYPQIHYANPSSFPTLFYESNNLTSGGVEGSCVPSLSSHSDSYLLIHLFNERMTEF